jgi:hypothetical protein
MKFIPHSVWETIFQFKSFFLLINVLHAKMGMNSVKNVLSEPDEPERFKLNLLLSLLSFFNI